MLDLSELEAPLSDDHPIEWDDDDDQQPVSVGHRIHSSRYDSESSIVRITIVRFYVFHGISCMVSLNGFILLYIDTSRNYLTRGAQHASSRARQGLFKMRSHYELRDWVLPFALVPLCKSSRVSSTKANIARHS